MVKSGRGLPQSKTLCDHRGRWEDRQVLECASPLALWERAGKERRAKFCSQAHRAQGKSGRGLPQSKTLCDHRSRWEDRQVLECASPLALWARAGKERRAKHCSQSQHTQVKSGRGLPHSKTLCDHRGRWEFRQVLECASPLALWERVRDEHRRNFVLRLITLEGESGRGRPQSKTLCDHRGGWEDRQVLDCASPLALCSPKSLKLLHAYAVVCAACAFLWQFSAGVQPYSTVTAIRNGAAEVVIFDTKSKLTTSLPGWGFSQVA